MDLWEVRYQKIKLEPRLRGAIDAVYKEEDWAVIDAASSSGEIHAESFASEDLERAYRRGVINRSGAEADRWVVAPYSTRLACMMEGEKEAWDALPEPVWRAIADYMMDPAVWLPSRVEDISKGKESEEWILPLEQARAAIEYAPEGSWFSLHQCNCNAYLRGCKGKENVCIHWSAAPPGPNSLQDRGIAGMYTRQEALEALDKADRLGLVHSVGEHGMCNCCTCCCINLHNYQEYPIRDSILRLAYVAEVRPETCIGCGSCTFRCPFGALSLKEGKASVDGNLCWGCGVCRRACPVEAIQMKKIPLHIK